MEQKKLFIGVLVIVLLAGVAGVSASASVARGAHSHSMQELAQEVPGWQQVNSNGFGDPLAGEVSALEAFNGYIYAGTFNPINPAPGQLYDGARIFRSSDGVNWNPVTDPGFGNTHDTAPPAILDFSIFNGYLFASTGRGNAAQIWRSMNGVNWARVVNAGFGDPDIVDLTVLAEYGGGLYVGATKQDSGAQIWRTFTGDGNLSNWMQVAVGTDPARITGLAVFDVDGGLYAAVQSEAGAPAQIWRSYGGALGTWTTVVSDGFGDSNTNATGGMAVFGGYLYVGAGNEVDGAQIWRTNDGTNWGQVITPAFGDTNNRKAEMVHVFQNQLYVSVQNALTGIELWRSTDGSLWERANLDGFGDSNNSGSNWSNATADFLGQLYVGTSNVVDGGELWRMQQQQQQPILLYLPLIRR
jgi:hypothetical protein